MRRWFLFDKLRPLQRASSLRRSPAFASMESGLKKIEEAWFIFGVVILYTARTFGEGNNWILPNPSRGVKARKQGQEGGQRDIGAAVVE